MSSSPPVLRSSPKPDPTRPLAGSPVKSLTRRVSAIAGITSVAALSWFPASAEVIVEVPDVVINEIETAGDWVELRNNSDVAVDITDWVIKDDNDSRQLRFPADTVIAPGGYVSIATNDPAHGAIGFGLGANDQVRIYLPDGETEVDGHEYFGHPINSYSRCPDGTGEFVQTVTTTRDSDNACEVNPAEWLVLNEIESQETGEDDWIEIANTATVPVDAGGITFSDSSDSNRYEIPAATIIAPGGYLVLTETEFGFGLGGNDQVRLFAPDQTIPFQEHAWASHSPTTIGRCPDLVGDFTDTRSATPGSPNDCEPPAAARDLVINEVESNQDVTDWVELYNLSEGDFDISGYIFRDDDNTRGYTLPTGSVVPAGGFFVIDQPIGGQPGFDFGLGTNDQARLFLPDGVTLVAEYSWGPHAPTTYGRCPDGTGEFQTTTVGTKGLPNDCSSAIRINEIAVGIDSWVELHNAGALPESVAGFALIDTATGVQSDLVGASLEPGDYLLLSAEQLGFSLPAVGGIELVDADATLVDSHTWDNAPTTSWGRCPDGTGPFEATLGATPGAINLCEGITPVIEWPGSADVVDVDDPGTFPGDLSGIDYEIGAAGGPGRLWAVENGNGTLHTLTQDAAGGWTQPTENGWGTGKKLRYPDGTGTVDAEGVTIIDSGFTSGVYVASERNNDQSSVSRPSILRYDVNGTSDELVATHEWNLAADFPSIGANGGLEGITWLPDSFLTKINFIDESTGAPYDPSLYPAHGDGVFAIGVEGTGGVYVYVLAGDQSFHRIAALVTSFPIVADVQFDLERQVLFVVCDDACDGKIAVFEPTPISAPAEENSLVSTGVTSSVSFIEQGSTLAEKVILNQPAHMPAGVANEGFALADSSQCIDGQVATFYSDDNAVDGVSIRSGSLPCFSDGGDDGGSDDGGSGGSDDDGGSDGSDGTGAGPGESSQLPDTGANVLPLVLAAAAALLTGSAAVAVRRTRAGSLRH